MGREGEVLKHSCMGGLYYIVLRGVKDPNYISIDCTTGTVKALYICRMSHS